MEGGVFGGYGGFGTSSGIIEDFAGWSGIIGA
jgi:hypothetical protein